MKPRSIEMLVKTRWVFISALLVTLFQISPVSAGELKNQSYADKWFKPVAFAGNLVGGCEPDDGGPGKLIQSLETLHQPYRVSREVKEGDKVVQTLIEITGRGELLYFRGKARCEAFVKAALSHKEAEKQKIQQKYQ